MSLLSRRHRKDKAKKMEILHNGPTSQQRSRPTENAHETKCWYIALPEEAATGIFPCSSWRAILEGKRKRCLVHSKGRIRFRRRRTGCREKRISGRNRLRHQWNIPATAAGEI